MKPAYTRFEVIPYRVWLRDDGKQASLYGAVPYLSDAEKARWQVVERGWTVRDNHFNTVGMGRTPFATREEAQAFITKITERK